MVHFSCNLMSAYFSSPLYILHLLTGTVASSSTSSGTMKPAWPATIVRQHPVRALSPPLPLPQMLLQWLPSPLLPLLPRLSLPPMLALPLLSRQTPVALLPSVPLPRLSLLVPLVPLPLQGARAGAVSCNVPCASVSLCPLEREQGRCLEASWETFGSDSV